MNAIKRSILIFILTSGLANLTFGQSRVYEQIKMAVSNSDIESLVSLAPEPDYGTLQFSTPEKPQISIRKEELGKHLTNYFESIGSFEYSQLFADKVGHLPLVVGKLIGNDLTQYVMIGLADFGGTYRYVSFSFLNELPPNMKGLDK